MGMFLTDADCIKQREYVNIPAWHNKGYLGEGLAIFCDDHTEDESHVECVVDIIQTILPKAKIYTGNIEYSQSSRVITECHIRCDTTNERLSFVEFINKYNIKLINNSTDGGDGEKVLPIATYMIEKIKQFNLICCGAAGNRYGSPTTNKYNGAFIMVTSVNLNDGRPVDGYKSEGLNIDFGMFHGFRPGTSFSSPFLIGMAGLLVCKNLSITQPEAYEYFKNHCEDILLVGKDVRSGWGVPIMGDPKTIIKIRPGDNFMLVDNNVVMLDAPAVIIKDRLMLPSRAIAENLDCKVYWDNSTRTATIERC